MALHVKIRNVGKAYLGYPGVHLFDGSLFCILGLRSSLLHRARFLLTSTVALGQRVHTLLSATWVVDV